jgi:hypothetical protein
MAYYDQNYANQQSADYSINSPYSYPQPNAGNTSSSIFTPNPAANFNTDPFNSMGSMAYANQTQSTAKTTDNFDDEPPLLEELGINFDQIMQKTLAVVNPLRTTDANILAESDLMGPLVFCLAFGCFLLLSGKIHFGYIYGIAVVGCLSIYLLLNLMSPPNTDISLICTISVLGYCLLPMVLLSGVSVLVALSAGLFGYLLALSAITWCSLSASKLFVTALSLQNQQPLIAYPCALFYGVFALLTVF